jgi:Glycosyltransferase family 87
MALRDPGGPLARHRVALLWALALALWASAAASAGARPYALAAVGAQRPADFGRDFVAAEAWLADGRVYEPAPDLARRHHAVLGVTRGGVAGPFYAHTPAAALVLAPLVPLGFPAAALVWLGLSIGLVIVLATVLSEVLADGRSAHVALVTGAVAFVALWPPVLYNLEKGQWSLMLATLIALGWRGLATGRPGWAGSSIGLAGTLKLAPAVIFPYLLLRRPRAALAFAATVGALAVGSVMVVGAEPWRAFLREVPANVAFWEDRLENAVSIPSLITRLFVAGLGGLAQPLFDAPVVGRWLAGLVTATLVTIALFLTWRVPAQARAPLEGAVFALWCVLGALINPLGWLHSSILLLLPAALVLRAATDPLLPLRRSARLGSAVAVVLAVALLSLPKETLRHLAGPIPVSPGHALAVLALPCYGAIALFAAAALVVQGATPHRAGTGGT